MGRCKLPLKLISDKKKRRITCEKRKKCLIKKVEELSILCGTDNCVVISDPDRPVQPEIWPSNKEVGRIIRRYQNEDVDRRTRRVTDLSNFFMNRKKKLEEEELTKERMMNQNPIAAAAPAADLSQEQLRSLSVTIRNKLDMIRRRKLTIKESGTSVMPPLLSAPDDYLQLGYAPGALSHTSLVVRRGAETLAVDDNGHSTGSPTNSWNVAWHPSGNSITCAAANSIYSMRSNGKHVSEGWCIELKEEKSKRGKEQIFVGLMECTAKFCIITSFV